MSFGAPRVLWFLFILVPVMLIQLRTYLRGRGDLTRLAEQWSSESVQTLYLIKWFFTVATFNLFVALSLLALADVSWGERPVEEDRESLDVVVALDISRSMLATDVEPSRLSRSLAVIRTVSRQLTSARFALVAFKGDAVTLLPLTEDSNALEAVLDGVSPQLVSAAGTDVERGLRKAMDAFPEGANAHRAILLFTDGESISGSPTRVAADARSAGIPVIAVISGTPEGATIPDGDGTVVTDAEGRPVVTRAVTSVLEDIGEMTSAAVVSLNNPDVVSVLTDELLDYVERRESTGFRLVPVRRYPLFVAAALVALGLSLAVRVVRWKGLF